MSLAGIRPALARLQVARRLHRLALFITLAGLAHLLTVLLIPRFAALDAASTLLNTGADGRADMVAISGVTSRIVDGDPATAVAVCGFDLEDGPLKVAARVGFLPLALSVHMRGGSVVYAVTDRAAQRGSLEFVVVTREQFEERVARDDEGEGASELRVTAPGRQGVVVARALIRQPSDRAEAEALARGMSCGVVE